MKYRLIAADMDGTLLNGGSVLTERTKDAIKAAVSAGVLFVTATGRPMCASEEVNGLFDADLPFITFNGATVITGKSKKILFSSSLEEIYVKKIYDSGEIRNIPVILWRGETLWVNHDCEAVRDYQKISEAKINIIENMENFDKSGISKMLWIDEPEKITLYQREMSEYFKGKVNCHPSRSDFLEFVSSKTSKGAALREIGKIYGIDKSEMIAVGDGYNDLSMLEYAGLGVAMENASDEVKAVCKYTVPSNNNEDGAAKVIEEFILNENLTGENKK